MNVTISAINMSANDLSSDVRIGELILLESMFPKQLTCDDLQIEEAVRLQNYDLICDKQITCTFSVDKGLEINIELPINYPQESLNIHCRVLDGTIPNSVQKSLNDSINEYIINDSNNGIVSDVISVIQKVQELWRDLDLKSFLNNPNNVDLTLNNETNDSNDEPNVESNELTRYWVYSHHIKSTTKRKLIIDLAQQLHLNGFTRVGKPGFICVEGIRNNCESFWTQIRSINWQRITLIETEHNLPNLSFDDFNEIGDNTTLFRLLESKDCANIVKKFLGFQSQKEMNDK